MEIQNQIYRYKLNNEITEQLEYFAKLHQYDDRRTFKEAWKEWIESDEINALLMQEQKTLVANGFTGDVIDKMFKSARYYYRKRPEKDNNDEIEESKKKKQKRKDYRGFSDSLLGIMDKDIMQQLKNHKISESKKGETQIIKVRLSPSVAYDEFCKTHKEIIQKETTTYMENYAKPDTTTREAYTTEISNKFKKTYKNRFYIIAH